MTKIFIYVHGPSRRLLMIKPSLDINYAFRAHSIDVFEMAGDVSFPRPESFRFTYDPVHGFKETGLPDDRDLASLRLAKHKVEVLIRVKSLVETALMDIHKTFSDDALEKFPIEPPNFHAFWNLMRQEKRSLFTKAEVFFNSFLKVIDAAADDRAIDAAYIHLVENVNIGVYSVTNQERKRIGVGDSQP